MYWYSKYILKKQANQIAGCNNKKAFAFSCSMRIRQSLSIPSKAKLSLTLTSGKDRGWHFHCTWSYLLHCPILFWKAFTCPPKSKSLFHTAPPSTLHLALSKPTQFTREFMFTFDRRTPPSLLPWQVSRPTLVSGRLKVSSLGSLSSAADVHCSLSNHKDTHLPLFCVEPLP